MVSEAQKRANRKWAAKNREKKALYRDRATAKKFIKDEADCDDLKDLEKLIDDRKKSK